MNADTKSAQKSTFRQLKRVLHNGIALAFLFVPMIILIMLGTTVTKNTVTALGERETNAVIASNKVSSMDGTLFREPIVSVTFDDGWRSIATEAAAVLADEGVATTQYLILDNIGDPEFMSLGQIRALKEAGHEIGSHSLTHSALGTAAENDVLREMKDSKKLLIESELANESTISFAYPYGSYSQRTNELGAPIYATIRNTNATSDEGFDHFDVNVEWAFTPSATIGYTIHKETPTNDIRTALEYTRDHNGWLVLTFHQIGDDGLYYEVTKSRLREILQLVKGYGIKTMTVGDAIASWER